MAALRNMTDDLSWELREMFSNHLLTYRDTGADAPADPRNIVSKFTMLTAQSCLSWVRYDLGRSIIADFHPVDLFFYYLPSPEEFEKIHNGDNDAPIMFERYDYAFTVFKYYTIVHGRDSMRTRHGDAILENLFRLLDRGDSLPLEVYHSFIRNWMFCEILSAVCHVRPETSIQQTHPRYITHTCRLIDYLSWKARGRKDSDCRVKKPWDNRDLVELRQTAPLELSCLQLGRLSGQVSCQETTRLYRLAHLFQVAFFQFILSNTGRSKIFHTVYEADGIVRATVSNPIRNSESRYAGIPAEWDLSRSEVKAVLYAYRCCDIRGPARALLEYFFRCE